MHNYFSAPVFFGFSLHRHIHRQIRDHFIPHEGNKHVPHVLHHRALFLYSLLLVLVKLAVLSSPLLLPYNLAQTLAITPENIVGLSNQSRTDYGLPVLRDSSKLAAAADKKARDMMEKGYFAHFSPDGISPWFWIAGADYQYSYAGENLAIRFSTAEGVNSAWLQSAAHRANILSQNFTDVGVAVLTDEFASEGTVTLVVQMFGAPAKGTSVAKAEPAPLKPLFVPNAKLEVVPATAKLPVPAIVYPLKDSFIKQSAFRVIGTGEPGKQVRIYFDDLSYGEVFIGPNGRFEFLLPEALSDGKHTLYARVVGAGGESSEKSETVKFILDSQPPIIFENEFKFIPVLGKNGTFAVTAGVSEDSIRTLISVGNDSSELTRQTGSLWSGRIALLNAEPGDDLPIQVYAQDLAGNEVKTRLGLLSDKDVKGVFSFINGPAAEIKQAVKLFGGLVTIKDLGGFAQKFYLSFVIFLASALMLKIAIARHIQHPKTVSLSAGVMMLAIALFAL